MQAGRNRFDLRLSHLDGSEFVRGGYTVWRTSGGPDLDRSSTLQLSMLRSTYLHNVLQINIETICLFYIDKSKCS